VLFAVDDWNALYWVTGYHEWSGMRKTNILPSQLRLANAVKSLLDGPCPAGGVAVAATTQGASISNRIVVPRPKHTLMEVRIQGYYYQSPCAAAGGIAVAGTTQGASISNRILVHRPKHTLLEVRDG